MIISGATREQIEKALSRVNTVYDGNLEFKNFEAVGRKFRVTLRVKSSRGAGARRSAERWSGGGNRTISACYHATGHFFDALPEMSKIETSYYRINKRPIVNYAGVRPYQTIQAGSQMMPQRLEDLCDCGYSGDANLERLEVSN